MALNVNSGAGASIRVLTTDSEFETLRDEWNSLHSICPVRSMFLTWEWLYAWWLSIRDLAELRIVTYGSENELEAAAALVRRRTKYYGVPLTEVGFLGEPVADRQFFLDASPHRAGTRRIWEYLLANPFRASLIRLEELPADSDTLRIGLERAPLVGVEETSSLPFLEIASSWSSFEKTLTRDFRSKMRTRVKVFDSFGKWEFNHVRGGQALQFLDDMADVERTGAKATHGRSFLTGRHNLEFLRRFLGLTASGETEPVLSILSIERRVAAYVLGFVFDRTYHTYNTAFAPEFSKGWPGTFVLHEAVRWAFDAGLSEVDFLRGDSFVKRHWSRSARSNTRIVCFQPGPIGQLLRLAVFRARPLVKRAVRRLTSQDPWQRSA